MFIQVRLLNGYHQPLWYESTNTGTQSISVGTVVSVPLRNKVVPAVVIHEQSWAPRTAFDIKPIEGIEPFPDDQHYHQFIKQLSTYYQLEPVYLLRRIAQFLSEKAKKEALTDAQAPIATPERTLTPEQQRVVDFITPHIENPAYTPTVVHGVTGSGKTEIYKKAIMHAHALGKTTILLLPEVTLAVSFENRLKSELGNQVPLYGFHSGCGPKEKRALWQALLRKDAVVIVGVHLPMLLPIANLGLIIIDEEHEVGYQEKKHPKINSKEAAIMRARAAGIPIILGSATPSIATLYNVKKRGWHFFQLTQRFAGAFPTIQTVSLRDKKERKNFWISQELYMAIKKQLANKEQTLVFINRRGFSFFVQCKSCSYTFCCSACSVSLTLHHDDMLTCHYCALQMPLANNCPQCRASRKEFLKKGIGTQQVVAILEQLFPTARIARADLDTTTNKKEWQETMRKMASGEIDVLVGTQTITKGYDFPKVTLVGILWADLNLHFPMYNAAETALQQIIQVAGRAGRHTPESLVIVQTMSDHTIFSYLTETDYVRFYRNELALREEVGYPPCQRLVEIEMKNTNEMVLERESAQLATYLYNHPEIDRIRLLGPALPPVHKIKHTHVRKIYLKGADMAILMALYGSIKHEEYSSSIYFVPNPVS